MKFELRNTPYSALRGSPKINSWGWTLTVKEGALARCPRDFSSEEAARSHIALAKKAMSAVRYAKVEVVE